MHAQKALIEISFNTLKGIKGLVESQNRHSAKQVQPTAYHSCFNPA